jgi:hypothetical protein
MKTQDDCARRRTIEFLRLRAFLEETFSYTCNSLSLYAIKYKCYLTNAKIIWELLLRDQLFTVVPTDFLFLESYVAG